MNTVAVILAGMVVSISNLPSLHFQLTAIHQKQYFRDLPDHREGRTDEIQECLDDFPVRGARPPVPPKRDPGRSFWRPAKNILRLFLGASLILDFGTWSFEKFGSCQSNRLWLDRAWGFHQLPLKTLEKCV
jgi:hypothetical protein